MSEVDPLSPSTRGHRRSLVGTSAAQFAVTAFGVTIENIQGTGLSIELSQGLVGTVLMSCAFYFLVHFVLYFTNDLSNGAYSQSLDKLMKRRSDAIETFENYRKSVGQDNAEARKTLIKSVESILKSGIVSRESATSQQKAPKILWSESALLVDIASRFNTYRYSGWRRIFVILLAVVPWSQKSVIAAVERRLSFLFFHKGSSLCFDRWLEQITYQSSSAEFFEGSAIEPISGLPFERKQTLRENLTQLAKVIIALANSTVYINDTDPEGLSRKRDLKRARRYYRWFYVRMWGVDLIVPISIFAVAFFLALADPNISAGIHQMFYRVQNLIGTMIDSMVAIDDAANQEPGFFCGWLGWTVAWSSLCQAP